MQTGSLKIQQIIASYKEHLELPQDSNIPTITKNTAKCHCNVLKYYISSLIIFSMPEDQPRTEKLRKFTLKKLIMNFTSHNVWTSLPFNLMQANYGISKATI